MARADAGLELAREIARLKNFLFCQRPFTEVIEDDTGLWLVEKLPVLNLANERPPLCSVTVSTLMSLLGVRVVREKRFQAGMGIVPFMSSRPADSRRFCFEFER